MAIGHQSGVVGCVGFCLKPYDVCPGVAGFNCVWKMRIMFLGFWVGQILNNMSADTCFGLKSLPADDFSQGMSIWKVA